MLTNFDKFDKFSNSNSRYLKEVFNQNNLNEESKFLSEFISIKNKDFNKNENLKTKSDLKKKGLAITSIYHHIRKKMKYFELKYEFISFLQNHFKEKTLIRYG